MMLKKDTSRQQERPSLSLFVRSFVQVVARGIEKQILYSDMNGFRFKLRNLSRPFLKQIFQPLITCRPEVCLYCYPRSGCTYPVVSTQLFTPLMYEMV